MVIKDQTGQIEFETSQSLPATTNVYVEALGICIRSGTNIFLKNGFYREVEPVRQATDSLPVLITAQQVKRLKRRRRCAAIR